VKKLKAQSLRNKKYRVSLRNQVIIALGGECANPFKLNHGDFLSDRRCLQIDHINGGGGEELKNLGAQKMYKKILEDPTGYQLLCANCNWIKRDVNGEVSNHGDVQSSFFDFELIKGNDLAIQAWLKQGVHKGLGTEEELKQMLSNHGIDFSWNKKPVKEIQGQFGRVFIDPDTGEEWEEEYPNHDDEVLDPFYEMMTAPFKKKEDKPKPQQKHKEEIVGEFGRTWVDENGEEHDEELEEAEAVLDDDGQE